MTYETMSEYIGFTNSKAVRCVHCKKTYLYATFWVTWTCACALSNTISHCFA